MFQLMRDLKLRLQRERKTQVIAVIVLIAALWLIFGDDGRSRRRKADKPVEVGMNDPREQFQDLIERFNGELKNISSQTQQNREDIEGLKKSMQDYEATTAEIFKKILERLAEIQGASGAGGAGAEPRSLGDLEGSDVLGAGTDELEPIGPMDAVAVQPPPPPKPKQVVFVGPGDSVRVKLLAGVNAPTDGVPYPVVFKLISDVSGPDNSSVPLGEARLIAAAQGSLTDQRALFRLTRLSIRMPNGRRKEFSIDGWVVGEDGIRGMEGYLIDPLGKAIVGAGATGFMAGIGEGIAASNVENRRYLYGESSFVQNDKIAEYAAGKGVASMAYQWNEIIRDRLAQMTPVVQVLSGREATAVFSQSLAIPDLLEQLDEEDPSATFVSLD